jgi:hypothetical protein
MVVFFLILIVLNTIVAPQVDVCRGL